MSPDAQGDMVFISHADSDHCEQARKRGGNQISLGPDGGRGCGRRMKEKGEK